ncbi:MAG: hypothetical protein PUD81_07380 [Eggerthellales bacterium]|nr:hypothetical protein [Eggerthellales bacterium]
MSETLLIETKSPRHPRPGLSLSSIPEKLNSHLQKRAAGCWQMIAAMGDDNLLALLIGKKANAQHFAAGPPPGARRFRRRALEPRVLLRHGASFLFVKLYCPGAVFFKKACSCWKKAFTSPMPG